MPRSHSERRRMRRQAGYRRQTLTWDLTHEELLGDLDPGMLHWRPGQARPVPERTAG